MPYVSCEIEIGKDTFMQDLYVPQKSFETLEELQPSKFSMLLSTMTYDQIYHEIVKDYHDLSAAFMKEIAGFQKLAKKAKRYPIRKIYQWKHPVSFNQYTYFFETKRHSDWDKNQIGRAHV